MQFTQVNPRNFSSYFAAYCGSSTSFTGLQRIVSYCKMSDEFARKVSELAIDRVAMALGFTSTTVEVLTHLYIYLFIRILTHSIACR